MDSGTFSIIIQNEADTNVVATLTLNSSPSEIRYAMVVALYTYLSPSHIECDYFVVTKSLQTYTLVDGTQSTTLILEVTFQKFKTSQFPYTLLAVNIEGLRG